MKIYYHPVSTTSRMLMLFAADAGLKADFQTVDLFTNKLAPIAPAAGP